MLAMKNWKVNRKDGELVSFAYCSRISTFSLLSLSLLPLLIKLTSKGDGL